MYWNLGAAWNKRRRGRSRVFRAGEPTVRRLYEQREFCVGGGQPPGQKPLIVNGVVVGPFEEDNKETGVAGTVQSWMTNKKRQHEAAYADFLLYV